MFLRLYGGLQTTYRGHSDSSDVVSVALAESGESYLRIRTRVDYDIFKMGSTEVSIAQFTIS